EAESYTLDVTENLVEIKGADEAGVFYGVQSLKQIFYQCGEELPEIHITDKPAYPYRGFMLDSGRYFFPKEDVKKFIDIMALHKLNRFHWHLTEDQGWRAQMLDNILLTEIGSYRSHTNFNNKPHGGYYTKEDMKEVVEYAHKKCIKVIPEIDTPGHTVSAIAAYPHLSCFDRNLSVATHCGVKHDVVCAGKESTYEFMFSVFDELLEVFTDGLIHIGGDEVPTTRWKICPHCQQRIKDEGLSCTEDLHPYYLSRLAEHIEAKGSKVIMWNDTVRDYMAKGSIVRQLWDEEMSEKDVVGQINKGTEFIISFVNAYYLDLPYGRTSLEKCYNYNPCYKGISKEQESKLLGVEACLWTEFVPTMKKAGYQMFPRLGAYSETAWTSKENKSFDYFSEKLDFYEDLVSSLGMNYATKKQSMPKGIKKLASMLYWERRQLCWQGLHNLIDNASVERKHKGEENK
ncbi:MAG: beta-N-acetylhexosaminidase, partial [Clostridia bacterium]|nr:beta-N-acetylhexosaminidase [Clostridia bacterium]